MNLVCCWCEGRLICCCIRTWELNTQIIKVTQSSERVQKDLPLTQPLGGSGTDTQSSPLSMLSLPMSSAGAEPGLCSSPPDERPFLGGGKYPSQSLWLYKVDLRNRASDLHPQLGEDTHRASDFRPCLLSAFFSCLSTPVPCRSPCAAGGRWSVSGLSLHVHNTDGGRLILRISETNLL